MAKRLMWSLNENKTKLPLCLYWVDFLHVLLVNYFPPHFNTLVSEWKVCITLQENNPILIELLIKLALMSNYQLAHQQSFGIPSTE